MCSVGLSISCYSCSRGGWHEFLTVYMGVLYHVAICIVHTTRKGWSSFITSEVNVGRVNGHKVCLQEHEYSPAFCFSRRGEIPLCRPLQKRLLFALPCADIRMVPNWERIMLKMYMSPCLFNVHAEYIMQNARLDEAQAGIKIVRRNINNLRYADDTTLMAESEEELKSLLMKVKEESQKAGLKLNIQKTKIMASGPITSWQIDGEIVETGQTLYTLAPKSLQMMTAAMKLKDTCSLKESYDQTRPCIKQQRHY